MAVGLAGLLGACGKKGELELPPTESEAPGASEGDETE